MTHQPARDVEAVDAGVPEWVVPDSEGTWRRVDDLYRLERLGGAAAAGELAVLSHMDPSSFVEPLDRIAFLQRVEKVEALVAALKVKALVAVAGETASAASVDEVHVAVEVALARRVGPGAASTSIELARALATSFPDFRAALEAGEISEWHCRELVTGTRSVSDADVLAKVARRTLPKAKRQTPREFAREVATAVTRFDREAAARRERARDERRVWCRPLPDGMGFLGVIHDWPTIHAMHATITSDGRSLQLERGGAAAVRSGDDDARADASRADAMAVRLLGSVSDDGTVTWDRDAQQVVTVNVVIDLDTLRGERDRLALVDGEPVPAELARDLAQGARLWRRAITDPVTGALLDYGTEQYLPEPLRRFVLARDGRCGTPVCPRTGRLQMDHAVPFPAGASTSGNCRAYCTTCHQLKTAGRLRPSATRADGSGVLTSAWGQTYAIPARPFLHDPADLDDGPEPAALCGAGDTAHLGDPPGRPPALRDAPRDAPGDTLRFAPPGSTREGALTGPVGPGAVVPARAAAFDDDPPPF